MYTRLVSFLFYYTHWLSNDSYDIWIHYLFVTKRNRKKMYLLYGHISKAEAEEELMHIDYILRYCDVYYL